MVPIVQHFLFQDIIGLHRDEPKTAPEWSRAIDGDEAGRRVSLGDGKELGDALLRQATSSELGQYCEIVDVVMVRVGGNVPKQAVQSRRLEAPDGM